MHRLLISAAALCFAAAASAAPYTDNAKGFTVDVPEGWTKESGGEFPLDLALLSPRRETTAGVCLLMSQEVKHTKELTQAELNKLVVEQATEEFWRTILTSDNTVQVKDLKIKASHEARGERTIGRATVLVTATRETLTMQLQFEMMLQAVPGNSYMTHCSVRQDQVAAEAGDIKIVIDTHTPTGTAGLVASAEPPRGGATPVAAPRSLMGAAADAFKTSTRDVMKRARR
jgi:hypothetical protein